MVGGVIKDPRLRPYKLEKKQKCRERRGERMHALSLFLLGEADEEERSAEREDDRRVRRQPVTNLTLNQVTCARPHKRAPVHASARERALDAGYLLVICVTLCMRCLSLSFSLGFSPSPETRIRRPAK